MRAAEIIKSKLMEMPFLMSGPLSVPLHNDAVNSQTLATMQASQPIVVQV